METPPQGAAVVYFFLNDNNHTFIRLHRFTAATTKAAWMYQLASAGDFAAEAFGIGDTVTMSFTTTLNADAVIDPQDFRFAMWDHSGEGGASVRMDWGPLTAANVAAIGVGDNMHLTTPTTDPHPYLILKGCGSNRTPLFPYGLSALHVKPPCVFAEKHRVGTESTHVVRFVAPPLITPVTARSEP